MVRLIAAAAFMLAIAAPTFACELNSASSGSNTNQSAAAHNGKVAHGRS
jgi:hypothetical protein